MANVYFPWRTSLTSFRYLGPQSTSRHGQIKCVQGPWPATPCARRPHFPPAESKPPVDRCRIPCLSRKHVGEDASPPFFSSRGTLVAGLLWRVRNSVVHVNNLLKIWNTLRRINLKTDTKWVSIYDSRWNASLSSLKHPWRNY